MSFHGIRQRNRGSRACEEISASKLRTKGRRQDRHNGCIATQVEHDGLPLLVKMRRDDPVHYGIPHPTPMVGNASSVSAGAVFVRILVNLNLLAVPCNGLTGDRKEWLGHLARGHNGSIRPLVWRTYPSAAPKQATKVECPANRV